MLSAAKVALERKERALQSCQYDEKTNSYTVRLEKDQHVKCTGSVQLVVKQGSVEAWGAILTPETGILDKIWLNGQEEILTALENDTVMLFCASIADWTRIVQFAPIVRGFFPGRESTDFAIKMGPRHDEMEMDGPESLSSREKCKENWKLVDLVKAKKFLIMGPKSSGKSSFARFLTNRELAKYGQNSVAFMELDPGQPELGPPGSLSLHLINEPLIGASFCSAVKSQHKLVKMHFFGYTTPRDNIPLYISLVENLVATYREIGEMPLLIINTCGWVRGLGNQLLIQIQQVLGDEMHSFYLGKQMDEPLYAEEVPSIEEETDYGFNRKAERPNRLNAQDSRMLQMMTYFNGYSKDWKHLTERTPYVVPLEQIAGIAVWNSEQLSSENLHIVLPGTLVALLKVSDELFPLDMTDGGLVAESRLQPEFVDLAGYAVVQSIETANDDQNITALRLIIPDSVDLTSLDASKLVIARGKLQLSIYEIWNPKLDNRNAPFLAYESHGVGSNQWRVRRNIQRKGHSNGG